MIFTKRIYPPFIKSLHSPKETFPSENTIEFWKVITIFSSAGVYTARYTFRVWFRWPRQNRRCSVLHTFPDEVRKIFFCSIFTTQTRPRETIWNLIKTAIYSRDQAPTRGATPRTAGDATDGSFTTRDELQVKMVPWLMVNSPGNEVLIIC